MIRLNCFEQIPQRSAARLLASLVRAVPFHRENPPVVRCGFIVEHSKNCLRESEIVLQSKLNDSRCDRRRCDRAECCQRQDGSRIRELWRIERVKEFRAEFYVGVLSQPSDGCHLNDREVHVVLSRSPHSPASDRAETKTVADNRRRTERCSIQIVGQIILNRSRCFELTVCKSRADLPISISRYSKCND